ncbi:uncharacterized protein LOC101860961, partial [Aplysia californica]|uniref:Uncharacterized protein LOC101860961 n=1 Tax=Aplysia californica TaxID=6500 RepID=A0ABM0JH73_APLCA
MSSSEEDAFQDAYVAVGSLESERFFDATPGSWAEEKGPAHHLVSDRERFPHYEGNKSEVNRFPIDFIDNVHGGETSRDEDDDGDEDKNENCPREGRTLTNKIAPIETSSETSERDGFYSDIALLSEEVDKNSDESPRPRSQVIRGADTKVIHGPEETDGRVKEQLCEVSDPEDTNSRFIVDSSDSVIPQLDADSARLVAGVLQTDDHLVDDVDSVARAGRVTDGLGHAERIDPKQNDDDLKPSNVSESKIVSPSSTNVFPGFSEKKENAVKPDDSDSVRSPQIEEQQRFDSKSSPGSIASSESETAIGSNGESCESSQSAQQASSDEEFHYNMSENELNTFRDEDDLLHTAGDTCATHSLRVSGGLNKGSNSTEAAQTRAYNTNNDVAPDSSSQRKHLRSKETEQLGCLPEVPQPRHILSSLPSPCTNSTHKDSRDNSVSKTRPSISGITDESAFAQKAPKNPSTKLLHSPTLIRYDSPMVDEQAPPTQPSGSITPSVTSEHSANVPVVTAAARGMKNDVIKVGASTQQSMERVHATSSEDNSYGVVDDERTPLLCSRNEIKVYRRRWYVLFLFCLSALLQGLNWGTWGPITQSLKAAFDWTDGSVARLALVGNTSYVIFSVPVCLMVERKGMRVSMLVSMVLLTAGFSCPCVSSDQTVFTWMTTFGQVLVT